MNKWKKAISVGMSAAMLASLLTAAFVGTAFANTSPEALDSDTCAPEDCTQIAAAGYIEIGGSTGVANEFDGGDSTKLTVSGAGSSFLSADGADFDLKDSTDFGGSNGEFYVDGEVEVALGTDLAGGFVRVIGATAGTATIREWLWIAEDNLWVPDGNTWTLTFTSAAAFQVSAATSTVKTYGATDDNCNGAVTASGNTSTTGTVVGHLGVYTKNAGGSLISGATVSGSIQPYGTISADNPYDDIAFQSYSDTTSSGFICLAIVSAGLSGTSTITATAKYLGVTTPLSSTTFTFAGPIATLTASPGALAIGDEFGEITVKSKDANGNKALLTGVSATLSSGLEFESDNSDTTGVIEVSCIDDPVQSKETVVFKKSSIVSNTVTVWCSGSTWEADKLTVVAASASIPAGGSVTFTATLVDENSYPAPDGVFVIGLASAGLVIGDGDGETYNESLTSAGVATFTYYAQNTTGPITLTAVSSGVAGAGSLTVGITVAPSSSISTNANKLGLPAAGGSYSTTTKVAALNGYVTWRTNVGTANAGKIVGVYLATKNSAGIWSSFTRLTSRSAASDGTVIYYLRKSSATWASVRFSLDGVAFSPAVQARWR